MCAIVLATHPPSNQTKKGFGFHKALLLQCDIKKKSDLSLENLQWREKERKRRSLGFITGLRL